MVAIFKATGVLYQGEEFITWFAESSTDKCSFGTSSRKGRNGRKRPETAALSFFHLSKARSLSHRGRRDAKSKSLSQYSYPRGRCKPWKGAEHCFEGTPTHFILESNVDSVPFAAARKSRLGRRPKKICARVFPEGKQIDDTRL